MTPQWYTINNVLFTLSVPGVLTADTTMINTTMNTQMNKIPQCIKYEHMTFT